MTPQTRELIKILRSLHDDLAEVVVNLGPDQLRSRSYATEWTVADVLSHLGSGAELSLLRLNDRSGDGPAQEDMAQVWAVWDARTPEQQAVEAVSSDLDYLTALEGMDDGELARLHRELAGLDLDADNVLRLRIAEHAVHGWDVAVAFDDDATVPAAAVPVLLDLLPVTLRFAVQPHDQQLRLQVTTTEPDRLLLLELTEGTARIRADESVAEVDGELVIPAEALLRLVYGRLDPRHTPALKVSDDELLERLRSLFQGF